MFVVNKSSFYMRVRCRVVNQIFFFLISLCTPLAVYSLAAPLGPSGQNQI